MNKKKSDENEYRAITKDKIKRDKRLESLIVESQHILMDLSQILRDYIFMNSNSLQHPVLKRRSKAEFYLDFNTSADAISDRLGKILDFYPKKKPDDYTIVMKIIDVGSEGTLAWYHYNIKVIAHVLEIYVKRINQWNTDDEKNYEDFFILEGDASFLNDMCHDISSFIYGLYLHKAKEYVEYVKNGRLKVSDNPFVRYSAMPKMMKSHKAHSRTLLDSCEGILHRSFYKDDINAVPIVTTILRQMIELRFEELLGIQVIYQEETHDNVMKVVGSQYFDLPNLKDYIVLPIPLESIKAVYGWASEYVHRGVSDYYWIIFCVKQYLLDFVVGNAYMEEVYYNKLKERIAHLFDVTEKSIKKVCGYIGACHQRGKNNVKLRVEKY